MYLSWNTVTLHDKNKITSEHKWHMQLSQLLLEIVTVTQVAYPTCLPLLEYSYVVLLEPITFYKLL